MYNMSLPVMMHADGTRARWIYALDIIPTSNSDVIQFDCFRD